MEFTRGDHGTTAMLAVLILSLIFAAGFCLGYVTRAWRSGKRRARHLLYAPHNGGSRASTFGHARRAF
jgi:hypothetical protein